MPNQAERIRKAWRVTVKGYDNSEITYAPSASKAKISTWRSLSDVTKIKFIDVKARRDTKSDVLLPPRDPLVDQMSAEEQHCLLHAFGGNGDPIKAGYRDYFYTRRDDPHLVALTERGLMTPTTGDKFGDNMTYFILTGEGKRVALSMVPEYAN